MSVLALKRPSEAAERTRTKRLKLDVFADQPPAEPVRDSPEPLKENTRTRSDSKPAAPRAKKFFCDFPGCGKAYTRPVRLAEHQRSHTNERPFACDRDGCDKTFLRDSHLKHHIKSQHDNTRDWVCDWPGCGQAFATGTRMRTHRSRHEEKEQFRCTGFPPCDQQFRKAETLQRHVASAHMNDAPYLCEHIEEGGSTICGRRFRQASGLSQHQQREHGATKQNYLCSQCTVTDGDPQDSTPLSFTTYSELQDHIHAAHPPTCTTCGYTCATAAQLKAHIDIEHIDLAERRTVSCQDPSCPRKFTRKGNMLVHFRSEHQQQKFICGAFDLAGSALAPDWDGEGACGRGFMTKASLEKHVRTQHLHLPLAAAAGRAKRAERKARMAAAEAGEDVAAQLTGVGYEASHPLPCALEVCQQRFRRAYDLELHLCMAHAYNSLAAQDAAEAVRDREALGGGQFWIGEEGEDWDLEQQLVQALGEQEG